MSEATIGYLSQLSRAMWVLAIGSALHVLLFIALMVCLRLEVLPLLLPVAGVVVAAASAWGAWVVCSPRPLDPGDPESRDGRVLRWFAAVPLLVGLLGFALLAALQVPLTKGGSLVVAGSSLVIPFVVGVGFTLLSLAAFVAVSVRGWVLAEWGTDTSLASWFKVLPFVLAGSVLVLVPAVALGPMMAQGFISFVVGTVSGLLGVAGLGVTAFTLIRLAMLCSWAMANRGAGLARDRRLGDRIAARVQENAARPEKIDGRVTQPLAKPSPQGHVLLTSSSSDGYDLAPSERSAIEGKPPRDEQH
jgi:hypothetical protein